MSCYVIESPMEIYHPLSCWRANKGIYSPPTERWPGATMHSRGQIYRVASTANIAVTRKHVPCLTITHWSAEQSTCVMTSRTIWCGVSECAHMESFSEMKSLIASCCASERQCVIGSRPSFSASGGVFPTSPPTAGQSVLASEVHMSLGQPFT